MTVNTSVFGKGQIPYTNDCSVGVRKKRELSISIPTREGFAAYDSKQCVTTDGNENTKRKRTRARATEPSTLTRAYLSYISSSCCM